MKMMIAGSRSIHDFDLSVHIPNDTELIITGGAQGVDTLAEQYADKHKISKLIIRPRYEVYGKAAPILRNQKMVEIADVVLVIWDGQSKGTKSTIQYAQKLQKELIVIQI